MKNKCYKNRKHCEKRRNHLLQAISAFPLHFPFFFFFCFCKRSIVRKNMVRKGEITYNKQFLLYLYIFLFFFFRKRSNAGLRNKIVEFRQVSFFHVCFQVFILYSLRKGYVLSMNGSDEGAEGYYGQLRLVMLYSCFKPLPHDFNLTLSQTTNVRLFQTQRLCRHQFLI